MADATEPSFSREPQRPVTAHPHTTPGTLFPSFFIGGYECSCHVTRKGQRRDLIAATRHDEFAAGDYLRLHEFGIRTARDGIRWHLIDRGGGYDFSSALPMIRAARETGTQVIWDICHYGWPDGLDIFSSGFLKRFRKFALALARVFMNETETPPYISPVNEISFIAWAGGTKGLFSPFAKDRGQELKRQLVRAAMTCADAFWEVDPRTRVFHVDPIYNVIADPARPEHAAAVERYRLAQYESWDMISGRLEPELGGHPKYLDIVGVNYYIHNQWMHADTDPCPLLGPLHPCYRPVSGMLREVYERYGRPVFIAETGIEADERPAWLREICREVRDAIRLGVPIEGICLYPIVDYPGWEDERHCPAGMWGYADSCGWRRVYAPLARELLRQQAWFQPESSSVDGRPGWRLRSFPRISDSEQQAAEDAAIIAASLDHVVHPITVNSADNARE